MSRRKAKPPPQIVNKQAPLERARTDSRFLELLDWFLPRNELLDTHLVRKITVDCSPLLCFRFREVVRAPPRSPVLCLATSV